MKLIKLATASAVLAMVAGAMLAGAGAASAATPAFEPDPNASNGSIVFYDASGNVVTSGNNLSHLFDYAVASSAATRPTTKANAVFAFPDHTKPDSSTWFKANATASANYPNASAPVPVSSSTFPTATAGPNDANLSALLPTTTLDTTPGYANIVQIQLHDSGPGIGNGSQLKPFWGSDIMFDQSAGTWQQVYPAPVPAVSTSITAISATPASPAPKGTTSAALSATLSASDATHPGGSVELFNGTTDLGPATLNAATGAISATATVADSTSYSYKFTYTPATSAYTGSASPVLTYSVKGAAVATTTTLTGPASANVGDNLTYTAAVSPSAAAGSVQFQVDGANVGNAVVVNGGSASFAYTPSSAGSKSVTAIFTPTDTSAFVTSTSNAVSTVVTAPAYAPDPQTVTVTVPAGTLTISTPYTPSNPFKLGTMVLNAAGTQYSASAPFGDPAAPASATPGVSNGVTVTDTRAGSTGWAASAQTTDFTNPSLATVIPGDNLSFTSVTPKYIAGNGLQTGSVTTQDITAFKTAKKAFAQTTKGPGSVDITGILGLTAPTSTLPGDYTATVTFTVG